MEDLRKEIRYEGIHVDILFGDRRPCFGDLFLICGIEHPRFPPTANFGFDQVEDLQFTQVDDYFGVRSQSDEGDDVPVWLFPLVEGQPVDHHPGPFDGLRLSYNILRNPAHRAEHFLRCIQEFARFGISVRYTDRDLELGSPPNIALLKMDIDAVTHYWSVQGITVGSSKALRLDW